MKQLEQTTKEEIQNIFTAIGKGSLLLKDVPSPYRDPLSLFLNLNTILETDGLFLSKLSFKTFAMLSTLKEYSTLTPEEIRKTYGPWKILVYTAIQNNGLALQYVNNEELQNDAKLITKAVKQNPLAIQYIPEKFRKEHAESYKKMVKQAITAKLTKLESGEIELKDIPTKSLEETIIGDNENAVLISKILKKNGLFLSKISFSEFKESGVSNSMYQLWFPHIIAAMNQNGLALQYTNNTFKHDLGIVSQAIFQNPAAFCHADLTLRQNYDSIKSLLKINGLILQYIKTEDDDLFSCAIDQNPYAIKYIPETFRTGFFQNYLVLVERAIKQNGLLLAHVSERMQNDKDIIETAVSQNPLAIRSIPKAFREKNPKGYREIVLMAVRKNGLVLAHAPAFNNDKEIVETAVKQNGGALYDASEKMKADENIVKLAVTQDPTALQYASKEIQENPSEKIQKSINFKKENAGMILHYIKNKETLLQTVKDHPALFTYLDTTVSEDKLFLTELLEHTWTAFAHLEEKFKKDDDLINIAFKQNRHILVQVPDELKNNISFMMDKVKKNGFALQYIGKDLKDNKDIVCAAIARDEGALEFIPEPLKKDCNFMLELIELYPSAQKYAHKNLLKEPAFISGLAKLKNPVKEEKTPVPEVKLEETIKVDPKKESPPKILETKSSGFNLLNWFGGNKGGKQDSTGSDNSSPATKPKPESNLGIGNQKPL